MKNNPDFSRTQYWLRFHLPNLIYLVLLLGLAAGSYWWISNDPNDKAPTVEKHPELVDAFAAGMTINRTNQDGSIAYVLTAQDIVHYGDKNGAGKNLTLVATPIGQPPMTAVAQEGTWSEENNSVTLKGAVRLTRAGDAEQTEMILTSDAVDVDLTRGLASTPLPFKVTQGQSEMTGKGFRYDYQLRNLTMHKSDERIKAVLFGKH